MGSSHGLGRLSEQLGPSSAPRGGTSSARIPTVLSAGYDAERQVRELEFASGRINQFDGVPRSVFDWLQRTASKGSFVTRMINGRYAYRDVTRVSSEPIDPEAALRVARSARTLSAGKLRVSRT